MARGRTALGLGRAISMPALQSVMTESRDGYTANRLRPFTRRAFSTFLPLLVAIRDRNPWQRFLLITLGW